MTKIYYLMRLYHGFGKLLSELEPLLGRKPKTLKKHARALGLIFPDYKPRATPQPKEDIK
jgi:hypothetical protein